MLTIAKVLNNNIAVVVDESGSDCIAMGRGIAFQRKRGDRIAEEDVERLFTQQVSELSRRFDELSSSIPEAYFEVAQNIIEHAKLRLASNLSDSIHLALTDHIHFAVERARSGQVIDNRLTIETSMVYPDEFECARTAVAYINRVFEVSLPDDEAAFIALHFVNAETDAGLDATVEMARIIQRALEIVREDLGLDLDEGSLAYYRFMVHLRFFAQRVTASDGGFDGDAAGDWKLACTVRREYASSYACAERIADFAERACSCPVPESERVYLALHIERLSTGSGRR